MTEYENWNLGSAKQPQPGAPLPVADTDGSGLDFAVDSEPSCRRAPGRRQNDQSTSVAEADQARPASPPGRTVVVVRSRWRHVANRSRLATLARLVLGPPPSPEIAEPNPWTAQAREP